MRYNLSLLTYRVEIEILEIQDWNESGSSEDSGDLPDWVLSDSDDEDDYPSFHQISPFSP
jgi:hypothetical protein